MTQRAADGSAWTYDEYGRLPDDGDRLGAITTRGVEATPHLVIEILSPGSERINRLKKPSRYSELGVPACWLVDPDRGAVEVYDPSRVEGGADVLTAVVRWQPDTAVTSLTIDVPQLFVSW